MNNITAPIRKATFFIAILALMGVVAGSARAAEDPMEVVKSVVNPALQVLADKQTPLPQRQDKLRQIVSANFDFTAMARSALGYHWKDISPDQQKEFTAVFTDFIEDAYLSKINSYSGQQVAFLKQRNNSDDAQVNTQIVQEGKDPITVDYKLEQVDGSWKVYDVTVDAISIIANYRNQFNRVMNNKGYATLISDLKSKQTALAASLGNH